MNYADIFDPTRELEALKPKADTIVVYAAPVSHRVVDLKRVWEGSVIGYNVVLCSHCHGRIDTGGEKDLYCRHCGYRIEEVTGNG